MKNSLFVAILLGFIATHANSASENTGNNNAYTQNLGDELTLYCAQQKNLSPMQGNSYDLDPESGMGMFFSEGKLYGFNLDYPELFDDIEQATLIEALDHQVFSNINEERFNVKKINKNFAVFAARGIDIENRHAFLDPDVWYQGEAKASQLTLSDLPKMAGLSEQEHGKWSYKITDISDDGKVIIGMAIARADYHNPAYYLSIKKGAKVAVYWTAIPSQNGIQISAAKPLALKLTQPKLPAQQISGVEQGLTQAYDIINYQEDSDQYLVAGQAHDGAAALMKLNLKRLAQSN